MAKKAGKRATADKPKRKKNGHAKPTAEKLSDDQRRVLLGHHKRKIVPLLEAERLAKSTVTKAYEIAKSEGITKKEIQILIALDSEEGENGLTLEVERIMRIARWSGVKLGSQLDLFAKPEGDLIFEEGRTAALNDLPARPPAHHGQKAAQRWLEGHAEGRDTLNRVRGEGFRSLSGAVGDLMQKAGIAASMQEPTPPQTEAEPESVHH